MLSNILLEGKTRSVPIKPRLVPVSPSPSILNDRQGREEGEEASLIEWTKDIGGKRERGGEKDLDFQKERWRRSGCGGGGGGGGIRATCQL